MRYRVTISKKGQISIPAAIRRQLGLVPGQKVRQSIVNGKLVLDFGLLGVPVQQDGKRERKD